ncbi:expressed unknown protein [Seminavis robusta]|uniref:Uncharacterized protein n=1 Tax=Seminavis robusta TaxID=568900 RepID=A0A9N8HJU4_9STRA|nr:expressed unknown protein [Seminavis robusta]|eukprot:Sro887_g216360.1 n/a (263) ;mRNA; r:36921-37709
MTKEEKDERSKRLAALEKVVEEPEKRYETKATNEAMRVAKSIPRRIDFIDDVLDRHFLHKPGNIGKVEGAFAAQLDRDGGYWNHNTVIATAIPLFRDILSQLLHELTLMENWLLIFLDKNVKADRGPFLASQEELLEYIRTTRPFLEGQMESVQGYFDKRKDALGACGYRYLNVENETIEINAETSGNNAAVDKETLHLAAMDEGPFMVSTITEVVDVDEAQASNYKPKRILAAKMQKKIRPLNEARQNRLAGWMVPRPCWP